MKRLAMDFVTSYSATANGDHGGEGYGVAKLGSDYYFYCTAGGGATRGIYKHAGGLGGASSLVASGPGGGYYVSNEGGIKNIGGRLYYYYIKRTDTPSTDFKAEYQWSDDGAAWTTVTSGSLGAAVSATIGVDLFVLNSVVYMQYADRFLKVSTTTLYDPGEAHRDMGYTDTTTNRYYFHDYDGANDRLRYFDGSTFTLVENISGGPGAAGTSVGTSMGYLFYMEQHWVLISHTRILAKIRGVWAPIAPADQIWGFQLDTTYSPTHLLVRIGTKDYLYKVYGGGGCINVDQFDSLGSYGYDSAAVDCLPFGSGWRVTTYEAMSPFTTVTLEQKDQFSPVTGKLLNGSTTMIVEPAIFLVDDADVPIGGFFIDTSPADPNEPNTLTLTGVEAQDLAGKVYETYTAATSSAMLVDVLGKYNLYLHEDGGVASTVPTHTITLAGQTMMEVLRLYSSFENKAVYWDADGTVTTDAGDTASGTTLVETAIFACQKVTSQRVSICTLRSGGLTSIKTSTSQTLGYRTIELAIPFISNQTDLDALNVAILARINTASYYAKGACRLTSKPLIGRTYAVTYNISPMSINAATLVLLGWRWNGLEMEFTFYDALCILPREFVASSGTAANILNGDLSANGHFLGAFITWRDAATWDYSSGAGLNNDGSWHTAGISAIVPPGASNVVLWIWANTAVTCQIRKTGTTNKIASVYNGLENQFICPLDASRQFDYSITASGNCGIQVMGWF